MVQRGYRIQKNHGASVDGNAHHGERIVLSLHQQDYQRCNGEGRAQTVGNRIPDFLSRRITGQTQPLSPPGPAFAPARRPKGCFFHAIRPF